MNIAPGYRALKRALKVLLIPSAAALLMANANGRGKVASEGNTGAPGEPDRSCFSCHNGGPFGPVVTLVEVEQGGQLVVRYGPGQTYDVRVTVAAGQGNPAGYGFQLTAIDNKGRSVGTWQNPGNNVQDVTVENPAGRRYLEHKGGASAARTFTARWVAPAAGTGTVDMHYSGVVVDGNNARTGDNSDLGSSISLFEAGQGLPYFENFELGPGGWTSTGDPAAGSPSSWAHSTPTNAVASARRPGNAFASRAFSGLHAWVTGLSGTYHDDEFSYLESPRFDCSTLSGDPIIEFALHYDTEWGMDGGWLEMSVDDGWNWNKVGSAGSTGSSMNWYNEGSPDWGDWWSGSSGGWISASHRLHGAAGFDHVMVRFVFVSNGSITCEGIAIDDVAIHESPEPGPCDPAVDPGCEPEPCDPAVDLECEPEPPCSDDPAMC